MGQSTRDQIVAQGLALAARSELDDADSLGEIATELKTWLRRLCFPTLIGGRKHLRVRLPG